MPLPSPIAVVGAGFVGRPLAERLAAEGHEVIATTRSGAWTGESTPEFEVRSVDLVQHSSAAIAQALSPARAVVLCYSSGGKQDRRRLFVEGGARIIEALERLGPERVVYTSSTSALPDLDEELDETCEQWPDSERGKIQREAEEQMRARLGEASISTIVLRLAGLYGPGRGLERIYRRREEVLPGDGHKPTNLVHRDDVVEAIVRALALPAGTSDLIHVCDDDHTSRREMYARLAAATGQPPPTWAQQPAPGAAPVGKTVSNARMKRVLGDFLRHPRHCPPPI